jgi:hypothetical protein
MFDSVGSSCHDEGGDDQVANMAEDRLQTTLFEGDSLERRPRAVRFFNAVLGSAHKISFLLKFHWLVTASDDKTLFTSCYFVRVRWRRLTCL